MQIGLVLLSFGVGEYTTLKRFTAMSMKPDLRTGNMLGSILGGRYSDYTLRRMKEKNGGVIEAEVC